MPNQNEMPKIPPTELKTCPYFSAATVVVDNSKIVALDGKKGDVKTTALPMRCLGQSCQLWFTPPGVPATCGNCSLSIAPAIAGPILQLVVRITEILSAVGLDLQNQGIFKSQIFLGEKESPSSNATA